MFYSLTKPSFQTSPVATLMSLSLAMLLIGCSHDVSYKRQVDGNMAYLQAAPLQDLKTPPGMILPLQNRAYHITAGSVQGAVGKALDIRPPQQPLALLTGSRAQYTTDTATIIIESSTQNSALWAQVVTVVEKNGYKIASRDDANQTLTTDKVQWHHADENFPYQGRFQITLNSQGYQRALKVKMLELKQRDKTVTSPTEIQRYTNQILNSITADLDKIQQDQQNRLDHRRIGQIDVQSHADDTGLPVLIVRTTYSAVWERLPNVLAKIGMKVTDSSRPQGSVMVKYSPPDKGTWKTLRVTDPQLAAGDYKLQLGDLGNRSSIQFIDPKGHVLTQPQNDAMVAVLQAAFNQSKTLSK